MELRDHLNDWLGLNEINLAPTTAGWYRSMAKHLEPIADLDINELTTEAVNKLWLELLKTYSRATVRGVQKVLSLALSDAGVHVTWRRIPKEKTAGRHGVWTAQQARTFLRFASRDRYSHGWALVLVLGLRRGELCGLRWSDVDLDEGLIHITQQHCLVNGRSGVLVASPKGTSTRTIPIGPGLLALLSSAPHAGEYVLMNRKGQPLYPTYLSQHWARLCKRAGVPVIALHDARHTSATVGASVAGVDLKTMQARLGHADAKMLTEVYMHVVTESGRSAAVSMERAFGL